MGFVNPNSRIEAEYGELFAAVRPGLLTRGNQAFDRPALDLNVDIIPPGDNRFFRNPIIGIPKSL